VEHKLVKVDFDEILYLESFGEYVKVFTTEKMHLTLRSLSSFEGTLPAAQFCRVHRSFFINLDKISVIEEGSAKVGGKLIPISRRMKEEFMEVLKKRGAF
jgi:DNA-binding LytR/AlgR family response regulator